ncbi:MAG: HEPN domain-containing protein [Candidatus Marsarchaeota archaeon]|jgi:HEPN domain-containing protein|nr:HEPN domain-containing protein [Candidatus Marsarchaeota archaeon]MCL5111539.1 HEPN domain-containing protein [Candidatus Marsarchaeota archaeon]
MGRGGGPEGYGLLKKAQRDFELARRRRDSKELVAASLLYSSAIERVLRALFFKKTHRSPPERVSIAYLTTRTDLPQGIKEELMSIEDEMADVVEEELEIEHAEEDILTGVEERHEYNTVLNKGALARRLISYAYAKQ